MPCYVYPADSRPPVVPDAYTLKSMRRVEFRTETEAVDYACELLKVGRFVAAIERADGFLIGPEQIFERCFPLARFNKPAE